jgi:hypothetical protein
MADMSAEASAKTLWMGDLAYWMDEAFVYSVFVGAPLGSLLGKCEAAAASPLSTLSTGDLWHRDL